MGNQITVNDIENKIRERMELLEKNNEHERLAELGLLLDFILNGEDY